MRNWIVDCPDKLDFFFKLGSFLPSISLVLFFSLLFLLPFSLFVLVFPLFPSPSLVSLFLLSKFKCLEPELFPLFQGKATTRNENKTRDSEKKEFEKIPTELNNKKKRHRELSGEWSKN